MRIAAGKSGWRALVRRGNRCWRSTFALGDEISFDTRSFCDEHLGSAVDLRV